MKSYYLGLALALSSTPIWAETVTQTFDPQGITRLEARNGSGDIKITGGHEKSIEVIVKKERWDEACTLKMAKEDAVLVVVVEKKSSFTKADCEADFDIKLPAALKLDIKNGSGDLTIAKTTADIEFKAGSGDVEIDDVTITELKGKAGSGDVELTAHALRSVNLDLGSGDTEITLKKKPEQGSISVKSGSGSVMIQVPKDTKLTSALVSGSGSIKNEVGDDAKAEFKVSVKTGSGDLTLKKL